MSEALPDTDGKDKDKKKKKKVPLPKFNKKSYKILSIYYEFSSLIFSWLANSLTHFFFTLTSIFNYDYYFLLGQKTKISNTG